jgi:uncharacterized protein YbbC (DUF1343 family)
MPRVQLGIEALIEEKSHLIKNKKIGVVCHPASVDSQLRHTLDLLHQAGAHITAIFGPEHGARGEAQDMEGVDDESLDPKLKVPVHSLYGATYESLTPTKAQLAGLDLLVIDLQDVGARYYTFVWTMALCMKAAGEIGLKVLVCDRPNPINGEQLEGNILQEPFSSFVGLHPLPNRHGMTPGEIALYVQKYRGIKCDTEIIPMKGWQRSMYFDETGLPWVYPSPNMPTIDTATVYTGMCLVEATELSEGRGTCKPFEVAGAPGVDPERLAAELSKQNLAGCVFRPLYFRPQFQKHAKTNCGGVQIHITDRRELDSYLLGVAFLRSVNVLHPEAFRWRQKPYEFVDQIPAIDLLAGNEKLRLGLEANIPLSALSSEWAAERDAFAEIRTSCLLYSPL